MKDLPPRAGDTVALDQPLGESSAQRLSLPDRYEDLGLLGSGGMGEVRRVWDRHLRRTLAMKFLRAGAARQPTAEARFLMEAWTTAGLQHPGIIVVHDQGVLPDGRPWLTMREVRGRTFAELYAESHQGGALLLRRRVDELARACEAVAFAHDNGVVHRDLKPLNLMVGEHGEVLVLDWGLASRTPEGEVAHDDPEFTEVSRLAKGPTYERYGTPGYLAPELLEHAPPAPAADVYALGVVLHELLAGRRPPEPGVTAEEIRAGARGQWVPPQELCGLCARALEADPRGRLPHAGALAGGLRDWLDGVRDLERATELMGEADALAPEASLARTQATRLRAQADAVLAAVPAHAPEAEKRPGWALEDEAEELERRADRVEQERIRTLSSALELVPDLEPAHRRLAAYYRAACERSVEQGSAKEALRLEALVRVHDRGEHAAWLSGEAALTLVTDPPDARVRLSRYVRQGRRLVAQPVDMALSTPLRAQVLPHGSYLLEVDAPGFATLRYPVLLQRGQHWDGCPPGHTHPQAVRLHPLGEVEDEVCVVPEGWFLAGGDPEAAEALPSARLWLERFAMQRHPVTNQQYLAFLNDLVAKGDLAEAAAWAPREQGQGEAEACLYAREADGRFALHTVGDGARWQPDWPVTMVSWHAARAYAAWLSERQGVSWRLPLELEWEKAARGVDGRFYPWGNHGDPTWARMANSLPDAADRAGVETYPVDVSPAGVCGLGGNVRDWCGDTYLRGGPEVVDGRPLLVHATQDEPGFRLVRGGCWASQARMCRATVRFADVPDSRLSVMGFRLVRELST